MSRSVIITCAVTGSGDTVAKSDKVPVTPERIAGAAVDAGKAGAAICHIHVRDPETGAPSMRKDLYAEVVGRIRESGSDIAINLTTGPGAGFTPSPDDPAVNANPGAFRETGGADGPCRGAPARGLQPRCRHHELRRARLRQRAPAISRSWPGASARPASSPSSKCSTRAT